MSLSSLSKRLEKLERSDYRMDAVFLPDGYPIADQLDYFGVVGGVVFEREDSETADDFKARCLDYDRKHREAGQMPIFMCTRL